MEIYHPTYDEPAERTASRKALLSLPEDMQQTLHNGFLHLLDMALHDSLPDTVYETIGELESHVPGITAALSELDRRTEEFLS